MGRMNRISLIAVEQVQYVHFHLVNPVYPVLNFSPLETFISILKPEIGRIINPIQVGHVEYVPYHHVNPILFDSCVSTVKSILRQRNYRVEARGFPGRIQTCDNADRARNQNRQNYIAERDRHRHSGKNRYQKRDAGSQH